MSCNSFFTDGRMVTENYYKLTKEQKQALEIDIFKPLDFYEIRINRMRAEDDKEKPPCSSEQIVKAETIEDKNSKNDVRADPRTVIYLSSGPFPPLKNHEEEPQHSKEEADSKRTNRSFSCNSYFMRDRVVTENYLALSDEQKEALEIDIFKPLDFYEILFNRMKTRRQQGDEET